MADKREVKRKRKRIKVHFGRDRPKRVAFTQDLSHDGLFITTRQPERPGKYVMIELTLPDDKKVVAYGQVQWARKAPPDLVGVERTGGMGVRLTGFEFGEEDYRALVTELLGR